MIVREKSQGRHAVRFESISSDSILYIKVLNMDRSLDPDSVYRAVELFSFIC